MSSAGALAQAPIQKPNMPFIIADEIGWMQVGTYQNGRGWLGITNQGEMQ
jgi:hypothetical protein